MPLSFKFNSNILFHQFQLMSSQAKKETPERESIVPLTLQESYYNILTKSATSFRGLSRFQLFAFFTLMLAQSGWGYIELGLGYYTMQPAYKCKMSHKYEQCDVNDICVGQTKPQRSFQVNYDSQHSLNNWITQYELTCADDFTVALFGGLYYIGQSLSSIPVPWLADQIGRKPVFQYSIALQAISFAVLLVSKDIYLSYAAMFIGGVAITGTSSVGYVYMTDFLSDEHQNYAATISSLLDSINMIIITIYFDCIGKDYRIVASVGLVFLLIGCVGQILLTESPLWQLNMGRVKQAQQSLKRITYLNGVNCNQEIWEMQDVPLTRLQNDKEAQINNDEVKNTSTMYFLRQRDIQINMAIMVYIWCVCSINSSILSYSVVDLPGDIYKNTFGSTLAEITATICATFIYANLQAEKTFVISFCLAIFGGFLVVTSGEIYADLMPAFVILAKLGLSSANLASQIAQVELFPTLFCATSLGICSFASNLATIVAPYLAQYTDPLPMLIFCALNVGGVILSSHIRRTHLNKE